MVFFRLVQLAQFSIQLQIQHLRFQPASYCHKTLLIKAALIIEYTRGNSCGQNHIVLLLLLGAFDRTKNVKSSETKQVTGSLETSLVLIRIKLSRCMLILSGFWCLRVLTWFPMSFRTRCPALQSPCGTGTGTALLQHHPEPLALSLVKARSALCPADKKCFISSSRHAVSDMF